MNWTRQQCNINQCNIQFSYRILYRLLRNGAEMSSAKLRIDKDHQKLMTSTLRYGSGFDRMNSRYIFCITYQYICTHVFINLDVRTGDRGFKTFIF